MFHQSQFRVLAPPSWLRSAASFPSPSTLCCLPPWALCGSSFIPGHVSPLTAHSLCRVNRASPSDPSDPSWSTLLHGSLRGVPGVLLLSVLSPPHSVFETLSKFFFLNVWLFISICVLKLDLGHVRTKTVLRSLLYHYRLT